MQISKISSHQYRQNFDGVSKLVKESEKNGAKIITFVSEKGKHIGKQILKANGDIQGERIFSKGHSIYYNTSHGTLAKEPYVPFEYHFPLGKNKYGRKFFVFDLKKFKENLDELTSLTGIKRYIDKVEKAPKTTKFKPIS